MNITHHAQPKKTELNYSDLKPLDIFRFTHNEETDVAIKTNDGHMWLTNSPNDWAGRIHVAASYVYKVILLDHELIIKGEL